MKSGCGNISPSFLVSRKFALARWSSRLNPLASRFRGLWLPTVLVVNTERLLALQRPAGNRGERSSRRFAPLIYHAGVPHPDCVTSPTGELIEARNEEDAALRFRARHHRPQW